MRKIYLPEENKKKIIGFLKKEFNPKFIYLFGSFAKGEGHEDSDIDLAIYTDNIIDPYTLLMAAGNLSFEVKRDIQSVHLKDYTKQDSIVLNIQRAFEALNHHNIIDDKMLKKLKAMIGFRNIAVHNYQNSNVEILQKVIENHLGDFEEFIYSVNKIQ